MRTVDPALMALIASGAAPLAHCWRIERRDGLVMGFTEHDRPLAFGGAVYEPESGFSSSALEQELGLAVGGGEVEGALSSEQIAAADIDAGLYDGARVELWLVNHADTAQRFWGWHR